MISGGVVAIRQLINVQLLVTYLKALLNKSYWYSTYCITYFCIVYKLCFQIARCFFFVIFITGEDKVIWS